MFLVRGVLAGQALLMPRLLQFLYVRALQAPAPFCSKREYHAQKPIHITQKSGIEPMRVPTQARE